MYPLISRVQPRVTLRWGLRPISSPSRQAHLRLTTSNFFQLNTSGHCPYVTSSLTRGWLCRLQLLLALARAAIRSETRGTHDHILLSQIRDRSPYLYPPAITPCTGFILSADPPYITPGGEANNTHRLSTTLPLLGVDSLSRKRVP
jgi:hypothetical protein